MNIIVDKISYQLRDRLSSDGVILKVLKSPYFYEMIMKLNGRIIKDKLVNLPLEYDFILDCSVDYIVIIESGESNGGKLIEIKIEQIVFHRPTPIYNHTLL